MTPQKWRAVRWDWSLGGSPVCTTWLQQHVLRTLHRASWRHLLMRILVHREWEMWPLEIQIRLDTCVFQMTAVTPVRAHVDSECVSMAGLPLTFHVLWPNLLPATAAQSPLLHVSLSVLGHAHTLSWALPLRTLHLCFLNLPTRRATWEGVLCSALLQFLATELQPPCQSALPCASVCLFKYTSLASNPLFSLRRLQLLLYLPFSFPLASLRCISALAHPW